VSSIILREVPKAIAVDETKSRATFSPCRLYRYALFRQWGGNSLNAVMFIGLNPSTADEVNNDPTVRRCMRFAYAWGFDAMYMMNAYAFRSTDPKGLNRADDPVGPRNDRWLTDAQSYCHLAVACWGNHICADRHKRVMQLFSYYTLQCLGVNANGTPKHPLYIAHKTPLIDFKG